MNDQLDGEIRAFLAKVHDATPMPPPPAGVSRPSATGGGDHRRPGLLVTAVLAAVITIAGLAVAVRHRAPVGGPTAPTAVTDGSAPTAVTETGTSTTVAAPGTASTAAGPNHPPEARDDVATTSAGTSVTIDVLANDSDPDGDLLALVSVGVTSPSELGVARFESWPTQSIRFTPTDVAAGTATLRYTVTDPRGLTATANVSVEIAPRRDKPFLAADPPNGFAARGRAVTSVGAYAPLDSRAVLLGWPRPDGTLAPMVVAIAVDVLEAPSGAGATFAEGDVQGTVTRTANAGLTLLTAEWTGPTGRFAAIVEGRAVPTDAVVRSLAAAVTNDGTTLRWANGEPPAPFVDLVHQDTAARWSRVDYTRDSPSFAFVSVGATTDVPLNIAPRSEVERRRFGDCDGVMLTGGDDAIPGRLVLCTRPDGTKVVAQSALATLDELDAIVATARPATEAELAAIPIVGS